MTKHIISQKRTDKLYRDVAEVIMKVRIQCAKEGDRKWSAMQVEQLLYNLQTTVPEAAIKAIKKKTKK